MGFDYSEYRQNTYGPPTHYCNPRRSFDDNGAGTLDSPWNLIQAMNNAVAGNVVGILPGKSLRLPFSGGYDIPAFRSINSGTVNNRIVYVTKYPAIALSDVENNEHRTEICTSALEVDAPPYVGNTWEATSAYGSYQTNYVTFDGLYVDVANAWPLGDSGVIAARGCTGVHFKNFVIKGRTVRLNSNACVYRGNADVDTVISNFRTYDFVNDPTGSDVPQRAVWSATYGTRNILIEHFDINNCDHSIYLKGSNAGIDNYGTIRYGVISNCLGGLRFNDLDPTLMTYVHNVLIYNYRHYGINFSNETTPIRNIEVRNCTVAKAIVSDELEGAFVHRAGNTGGVTITHNIFDCLNGTFSRLMNFEDMQVGDSNPTFSNNSYIQTSGTVRLAYKGGVYNDLASWITAVGGGSQEQSTVFTSTDCFVNRTLDDYRVVQTMTPTLNPYTNSAGGKETGYNTTGNIIGPYLEKDDDAPNFPLEIILPIEANTSPEVGRPAISQYHRIFWAYPNIPYNIRAGVIGGRFPYKYTLTDAPSGMTVNVDTGEINWPNPTTNSGTITLTVTDSEGTVAKSTWSITVSTNQFVFVDNDVAVSGNGTIGSPYKNLVNLQNNSFAVNKIAYFRNSSNPYTTEGMTQANRFGGGNRIELSSISTTEQWVAYPGESPVFDWFGKGEGFYAAHLNIANSSFTVTSNVDKWTTGRRVQYSFTDGAVAIGGLTQLGTYYVIRVDSTTVRLASSLANALAGTYITFLSDPGATGTHWLTNPFIRIQGSLAYFDGLTFTGSTHKVFEIASVQNIVFRRCLFNDTEDLGSNPKEYGGGNSAFLMYIASRDVEDGLKADFNIIQDNTFSNFLNGSAIKFYAVHKCLLENNLFTGGTGSEVEGVAWKGDWMTRCTTRGNVLTNIADRAMNGNNHVTDECVWEYNLIYNCASRAMLVNQDAEVRTNNFYWRNTILGNIEVNFVRGGGPIKFTENVIVNEHGANVIPHFRGFNGIIITYPEIIKDVRNLKGNSAANITDATGNLLSTYFRDYYGSRGHAYPLKKTLYVDPTLGNDNTSYTSNSLSTPWQTLSRAVYGSSNPATPNATEAAKAGDTVLVNGGIHSAPGSGLRTTPAFNPVNNGSAVAPITFRATGVVDLRLSSSSGPVMGSLNGSYITWDGFYINEANVTPEADTGPIVVWGSYGTVIRNCEVVGIVAAYEDNHNAIRIELSDYVTIFNNHLHGIRGPSGYHANYAGVMLFSVDNFIIEHNEIDNCGSGIYVKSTAAISTAGIIRRNEVYNVTKGIMLNQVDGVDVYQNIVRDEIEVGLGEGFTVGDVVSNARIVNNTVRNFYAGLATGFTNQVATLVQNNIFSQCTRLILMASTFPVGMTINYNVYYNTNSVYAFGLNGSVVTGGDLTAWRTATPADDNSLVGNVYFHNVPTNLRIHSLGQLGFANNAGIDVLDLDEDGLRNDAIHIGAYVSASGGSDYIGRILRKTLYINAATGDDSVTYANNSQNTPWRTFRRAVSGSTSFLTLNYAEAAKAGDTVLASAGVYWEEGDTNPSQARYRVVLNPANDGLKEYPITIRGVGEVYIRLNQNVRGPMIGGTASRKYIIWDHLNIDDYYGGSVADTGPVVFCATTGCQIINSDIQGHNGSYFWGYTTYTANYNAIRIDQGANDTIVRNCRIHRVWGVGTTVGSGGQNDAGVMSYDSNRYIIEYCEIWDCGNAVFTKGLHPNFTHEGNIIRYNYVHDCERGLRALGAMDTHIYQNVIVNSSYNALQAGFFKSSRSRFVNNTIDNRMQPTSGAMHIQDAGFYISGTPSTTGGSLTAGTYFFRVSVLFSGTEDPGGSQELAVMVPHGSGLSQGSVNVFWEARNGATGYRVYVSRSIPWEQTGYFEIGATPSFTLTTMTGMTAGTPPGGGSATAVYNTTPFQALENPEFHNNLIINSVNGVYSAGGSEPARISMAFKNNMYYNCTYVATFNDEGTPRLRYTTLPEWQALGHDLYGVSGVNPLFVDSVQNNYKLQYTSPAKTVGKITEFVGGKVNGRRIPVGAFITGYEVIGVTDTEVGGGDIEAPSVPTGLTVRQG